MPANLPLPPWHVDAGKLRRTLQEISVALQMNQGPVQGTTGETLIYNVAALARTVESVANAAGAHRFGATDGPAGSAVDVNIRELRRTAQELRLAWLSLLNSKLSPEKGSLIKSYLASPAPTLLSILKKDFDENSHSDVLRWLLDPARSPKVAPHALRALVGKQPDPEKWVASCNAALERHRISVRREYVYGREWSGTAELFRIDLLIAGPDFTLAIENKVRSQEHDGQTDSYWRWLQKLKHLKGGFLLSPIGDRAACASFVSISYLELIDCLVGPGLSPVPRTEEELVLAGYLKTLAESLLRVELRALCP